MEIAYFFDSYALIEIVKKNPSYLRYAEETLTLTLFNLVEIYSSFLTDFDKDKADMLYEKFRSNIVDVDDKTLKEAVQFKKDLNKRNISYTDCIGYIYAKRHNMKFLTGDKEFEHLPNVEFVK